MQPIAQLFDHQSSSIERSRVKPTTNSIDIPDEIDTLIDNKMYRNKFRKLIREGNLSALLRLAEIARTKETPSRWFAMVTAKRNWERTLEFLAKVRRVAEEAAQAATRLGVGPDRLRPILKAAWRLRGQLPRLAAQAQEVGRDPERYFWWLYGQTLSLRAPSGRVASGHGL